ncbi:MAG: branched-chain amino acid transport system II carrier protein [Clostridium argentinense]|uniref:Branched-chain amino acid transport system carrier protein n=1 Tax=Clostridium faecium TaxID=2762223 RepID=A0ABR8YUX8_9CLOT|nr:MULTISPECIES: branched-chain amino acid transport system II carrier protein [Clostridium]MBD8048059.1 branched-chain amino acid transport system II carrier protein [Clostridium faecium]MBS5822294.1 branched-chain amino acid transport system II carrier protein [Clostridium argentinense]MDU1348529.1 branched-chain amino acid transport system II carrier protein [Clostridium argentinense]
MEKLSKKDMMLISLMLFSMFFGAGNLIIPPFLGQLAGTSVKAATLGFIISAVGLPILGVITVSKAGGLYNLASRVHPIFASVFTILIYVAIGPFLGIPRAGSLAFEMGVAPFLSNHINSGGWILFLYTLVYFSIAFWLSLTPSKLVERFGKVLTPLLLILIFTIFIYSIFNPLGSFGDPSGEYAKTPFFKGILDGYVTMDTIAALNFGVVISLTLKQMGIKDEKSLVSNSIRAGLIAGFLLTIIYIILAVLGAAKQSNLAPTANGATVLTNVVLYLFGNPGIILLGLIFSLACLTTSVGLITSCSQYFSSLTPKISYKYWVTILSVSSMILANMGLTKILIISVPVLTAIYPMAITLIILSFAHNIFKGKSSVYKYSMIFVAFISIIEALKQSGLDVSIITNLFMYIPLYSEGLGWIIPAIIGGGIGFLSTSSKENLVNIEV